MTTLTLPRSRPLDLPAGQPPPGAAGPGRSGLLRALAAACAAAAIPFGAPIRPGAVAALLRPGPPEPAGSERPERSERTERPAQPTRSGAGGWAR